MRIKNKLARRLIGKIKNEFPDLKWETCRFIDHGWDHYALILDDKIVFRFPKSIPKEHPEEFADEVRLLKYLNKRLRTPIPEYIYIARDRTFAGYNILAGRELTRSLCHKLSNREKSILTRQIADFLTRLHATPRDAIRRYRVRDDDQWIGYDYFVRNVNKDIFPRLSNRNNRKIKGFLAELKSTRRHKYSRALINSDLLGEHILWDKRKQRVSIIDFSDRVYGDPAADFAGLFEFGIRFVKRIYDLYGGKKDSQMLYRAQLYYKRIALYIMIDSLRGDPCTFRQGYELFRRRF